MISEILKNLSVSDRELLMIALEDDFCQCIKLADGMFIGVNIPVTSQYEILESTGQWYYGRIRA